MSPTCERFGWLLESAVPTAGGWQFLSHAVGIGPISEFESTRTRGHENCSDWWRRDGS